MAWWKTDNRRAEQELSALKRKLPAFPVYKHSKSSMYCATCRRWGLEGGIHLVVYTRFRTEVGNEYSSMMVYPCDFPNHIPAIFSQTKLKGSCGHLFSNGEICLTDYTSDPAITGVNVLDWAKDWYECYDIWCLTGAFPMTNYGSHRVR